MANKTSIEWTDYNWNFLRGCSRVSEGCRNCYAEGVAARFSGEGMPYEGLAKFVEHKPRWTGDITFIEDVLLQPLRWTKPRKIFVNSMSDLFHEKVTDQILDKAFAVMALTPQHTYQILTKRPERMKAYFEKAAAPPVGTLKPEFWRRWHVWTQTYSFGDGSYLFIWDDANCGLRGEWPLKNVWLGVSVEDQKTADERIPLLLQTPAAVRWISAEPLLGPIDLFNWLPDDWSGGARTDAPYGDTPPLDWVVVGGESGSNARPCQLEWIAAIVNQCTSADVPVFVKQLGRIPVMNEKAWRMAPTTRMLSAANAKLAPDGFVAIAMSDKKGGNIDEFPESLRIREFPHEREVPNMAVK